MLYWDLSDLLPLTSLYAEDLDAEIVERLVTRRLPTPTGAYACRLAMLARSDGVAGLLAGEALVELVGDLSRSSCSLKVSTAGLCAWAARRLSDSGPFRRALLEAQRTAMLEHDQPGRELAYMFPTGAAVGVFLVMRDRMLWKRPSAKAPSVWFTLWRGPMPVVNRRKFAAQVCAEDELGRIAVNALRRLPPARKANPSTPGSQP